MAKLWEKGYSLDTLIERFTVGNDYLLDRRLIAADAIASIAHARMLRAIDLLSSEDLAKLEEELRAIAREAVTTGLSIEPAQEDSHTFIEERLVLRVGEAGKRIHTGRSRNDQVLASTRLFAREGVLAVREALSGAVEALCMVAEAHESTPMPGRTHLQPAMPSTVALWAASYAEGLLDADSLLASAFRLVDRSPLGAAASYGVPLPLDRELVARELGFAEVQHNVLDVVSSRGRVELALLDSLDQIGIVLSRFATDLILFTMPEFAYFSLPPALCSGSSIMPQKRNPDGLELMRGKSSTLSSYTDLVRNVVRSLPSAYNRDVQETKEPLMRGIDLVLDLLLVASLTVRELEVNVDNLARALTPDVYATDDAIDRVVAGESFRDAYRAVASGLAARGAVERDAAEAIARRTSTGTPGNLGLDWIRERLAQTRAEVARSRERILSAVRTLAGQQLSLYPGMPPKGGVDDHRRERDEVGQAEQ